MATRKVRYKKLNIKTALPVLREDQIDPTEYESLTTETQIATGVEQAEENEFHLQAVLKGHGIAADKEIPVPPPQESGLNYDELYALSFEKPATYIRFSQTVEECIGCPYDMTEEDDVFLKSFNQKRAAKDQLSEDLFEAIMFVFEETAQFKTPYAAVDQTVVSYDEMMQGLQDLETTKWTPFAKDIYDYWKSRRQELSNGPLHPTLKFETHQDTDEMDPYVCFRRREVRQTRKTRARDVQSADKLKRLRRELEDGRQLIISSHDREVLKREMLNAERLVFEHRAKLKETKIRLGIKTDDDDLVNQKPQKKKPAEAPSAQRPSINTQLRLPVRPDGRSMEADLALLSDKQEDREKELRADVELKIQNHVQWNKNHVDLTRGPLPPVKGQAEDLSFRPAKTQYLMTPPASASGDSAEDPTPMDLDMPEKPPVFVFKGAQQDDSSAAHPTAFRRRFGRLGRLWIDRRSSTGPKGDQQAPTDRWAYDQDSDEEDEPPMYEMDPFDTRALKFRASIPLSQYLMPPRKSGEGAAAGAAATATARPAIAPPPGPPPAQTPS